MSFLNGLSAMGNAVAATAGAAAIEAQRSSLEEEKLKLADQMAGAREHVGRVEAGDIAAKAATARETFEGGQQTERLGAEKDIETSRETSASGLEDKRTSSAERIARGDQSVRREALTPDEVRTAEWLTKATPAQREAFQQALMSKSGMPLWMSGMGGDGSGGGQSAEPSGAPPGKGAANTPGSKFNEKALAALPPQAAAQVKSMVDGRQPPPSSFAMSKPYWQNMLAAANAYDPTFDQTTWSSRVATRKDFTAGQSAKAITAMNTALGHAGVVMDSFEKLNNFGGIATPLNAPVNFAEKTFGDSRQTNAQTAVSALSSEARKVFAATGGGNLTELETWEKNFPINGSPTQQSGAMKEFVNLLDSRLGALSDQYNRGMGKTDDPINLLDPKAQQVYERLTGKDPEDATGYPNGQKPPAAPNAPAVLPPIGARQVGKTYQTPTGPHVWMGNGWSPAPPQAAP